MTTPNRHSKKDAKKQKLYKKQQSSVYTRKQAERELMNLQDDRSESQFQDPIIKRAIKWWQRQDEKYFKNITIQQFTNYRDITTSNQIFTLPGVTNNQASYLLNYREEMVQSYLNSPTSNNKLRILYKQKNSGKSVLVVYSIENAIPNYQTQVKDNLQELGIKLYNKTHRICVQNEYNTQNILAKQHKEYSLSKQDLNQKSQDQVNGQEYQPHDLKNQYEMVDQKQMYAQLQNRRSQQIHQNSSQAKGIRLDLQQHFTDQTICQRIEKIEQVSTNMLYLHQIDKQLAMWQWELSRVNQSNKDKWNKMIKFVKNNQSKLKIKETNQYDNKIIQIKDKLYWGTILRSFEHGFKDKTKKMLQIYIENEKNYNLKPPKGIIGHNSKKFFQTDCKICFCSEHSDSNQVLYCDNCNTSFHLTCYGLTSVPQQQQYFCQRCTYVKKQQLILGTKIKKMFCQICSKINFPMKKIDDHFYHVTCLVIFNLVEFRDNKMVLKGSLTHQNILKMVIQNELLHEQCNYCRKLGSGTQLGMQIKCSYQRCENYFHPICAYLNGCKFELKATANKNLNVKIFCNDHLASRMQQVYLRRYMCNLNQTSSKSYQDFVEIYKKDLQILANSKQILAKNKRKYPNRILILTKFIKNLIKSREQKTQQIQTQTQRILNRLKSKPN